METITIQAGATVLTLINVFTVDNERQAELVRALEEVSERLMRRQPGFVSASIHRSVDGTRVAVYAQWESIDAFQTMRASPEVQEHTRAIAAIASFEPGLYEVTSVHA